MATTITLRDETTAGDSIHESVLEILTERITVRELIRSRVFQEVKDFNQKATGIFKGLVQPAAIEKILNIGKKKKPAKLDWNKQYDAAIEAFENKQIIILIDNEELDSLDDEIVVAPGNCVTFLKLIPLVGG